jgi:thiamine-monophosphate kinase
MTPDARHQTPDHNLAGLGEKNLIERFRTRLLQAGGREALVVDVGDDTAAFRVPGAEKLTLFTCDMMVENQHFRRGWYGMTPVKLGWKALATNVSDIAAMGGRPTFALVSVALPKDTEIDYIDQIHVGLVQCAQAYGVILAGGDTVGSPGGIVIDVSLLGEVAPERILRRSGAKVGDLVAVTGPLGAAAAGLQLLESQQAIPPEADILITALLEPKPKLREAQALAATGKVTAMMDLSDGLAEDLPRLCQESGVGATVALATLPVPAASRKLGLDAVQLALQGGEDYQLLFCFAPENEAIIADALTALGSAPPVVIGEITPAEAGLKLSRADGTTDEWPVGFQHFGE